MPKQRVRLVVTGKVQGVFFRQSLKAVAKTNNVSGWVKNLEDGSSVEAVLEGDLGGVDSVVRWARRGPANARVAGVKVDSEEFASEFSGFDVLY